MELTISAAWGKDYLTKEDALVAWESGKDFSQGMGGGPYLSINSKKYLNKAGFTSVCIRFDKFRKAVSVEL